MPARAAELTVTPTTGITLIPTLPATGDEGIRIKIEGPDGAILPNTVVIIDGKSYTTDNSGYVTAVLPTGNHSVKVTINGSEYIKSFVLGTQDYTNGKIIKLDNNQGSSWIIYLYIPVLLIAVGCIWYYFKLRKRNKLL